MNSRGDESSNGQMSGTVSQAATQREDLSHATQMGLQRRKVSETRL